MTFLRRNSLIFGQKRQTHILRSDVAWNADLHKDISDLKAHDVKVHDPAKLLQCLQAMFKPVPKNFKCTDCADRFEFDSELELHILTKHGLWKDRF